MRHSTGIPTAKSMANYVIHDDYTTSQALNAFLNAGGTTFYVARGEAVYEVEVTGLP